MQQNDPNGDPSKREPPKIGSKPITTDDPSKRASQKRHSQTATNGRSQQTGAVKKTQQNGPNGRPQQMGANLKKACSLTSGAYHERVAVLAKHEVALYLTNDPIKWEHILKTT